MAGLDGFKSRLIPMSGGWGPYDFNLYTLSEKDKAQIDSLPKSLEEALDALEADHDYLTQGGVFPERLIEIWIDRKRGELENCTANPPRESMLCIMICNAFLHKQNRFVSECTKGPRPCSSGTAGALIMTG